jgi:hypothetical protein
MDGVSKNIECQILDCCETTAANMGEDNRKKFGITERMPLTWQDAGSTFGRSELVDIAFGSHFKTKYLSVNKVRRSSLNFCHMLIVLHLDACRTDGTWQDGGGATKEMGGDLLISHCV